MMKYKGYIGHVEYDPDDKTFHGRVANIQDTVSFAGTSVKELEKAFRESVDDYLAFCKKRGEDPDKPFSGRFQLRIDPELHRELVITARKRRVSLNALVSDCLARSLRV